MRETALAFLISAFAASTASAATSVDNQNSGTRVEFVGSARIKLTNTADKETDVREGLVTKSQTNRPTQNNGTRFELKLKQSLGNDFYGSSHVGWWFHGKDNAGNDARSNHNFDHLYTRQLYVGVSHKRFRELTYGSQSVVTDDVRQTDLANMLSLSDGLLASSVRRSVQYVYDNKDRDVRADVSYGGSNPHGNDSLSLDNKRKDIWGVGAIKKFTIGDKQEFIMGTGVSHERFRQSKPSDYSRTAYSIGSAYTYDKTTAGLDLERDITKDEEGAGSKKTNSEIRTILYRKLTSGWRAYGMYTHKMEKQDYVSGSDKKEKQHQFMLGTEYYLIPKSKPLNVKTFVKVQNTHIKKYRRDELRTKECSCTTVVGLHAYWQSG